MTRSREDMAYAFCHFLKNNWRLKEMEGLCFWNYARKMTVVVLYCDLSSLTRYVKGREQGEVTA